MEKSFNKHYLEKNPSSGRVEVDNDGKPVIGKLVKADCRLEQRHVDVLNRGWKRSGVYFVSVKEQDAAIEKAEAAKKDQLSNDELKAKIEALELELAAKGSKVDPEKSEFRSEIEAEAKKLGIKFRENISDEKLIERINENKK